MKKNKKIIVMLLVTVLCIGFSATSIQVWRNAPSNKVSLIAAITVNDSDHNKIVGTKGIVSYAYTNDVKPGTISWTSVGLASDRTYAFCAVTYTTTKNKTYTEVITFYP